MIETAETLTYTTELFPVDTTHHLGIAYHLGRGVLNPETRGLIGDSGTGYDYLVWTRAVADNDEYAYLGDYTTTGGYYSWRFTRHTSLKISTLSIQQRSGTSNGHYHFLSLKVEARNDGGSWVQLWAGDVDNTGPAEWNDLAINSDTYYDEFRVSMTAPSPVNDDPDFVVGSCEFFGTLRHPTGFTVTDPSLSGSGEGQSSIGGFSNLVAWYTPGDAVLSGSDVTSWPDSSANSYNLDNKTGTVELASGHWDSGADAVYFSVSKSDLVSTNQLNSTEEFTLYVVAETVSYSGTHYILSLADPAGDGLSMRAIFSSNGKSFTHYDTSYACAVSDGAAYGYGFAQPLLYCVRRSSLGFQLFINGDLLDFTPAQGIFTSKTVDFMLNDDDDGLHTGARVYYGDIALFSTAHNDATRQEIESILMTQYGIS